MYLTVVQLLLVFVFSQNPVPSREKTGDPQQKKSQSTKQPTSSDQRGTEQAPFIVKTIPAPKTQDESAQDAKERGEKSANDRKLVEFTGILALVGFLQLIVFGLQSYYLRRTVEAAGEESEAMERAIGETSRSATAMEQVARHIEASIQTSLGQAESMQKSVAEAARLASAMEVVSKEIAISAKAATASVSSINLQMRAYLCVVIGGALYQERTKNIKFQPSPSIVNAGLTPAHKVAFKVVAAILPRPLPDDFTFPLPDAFTSGAVIGPRQTTNVNPLVDEFCDDSEVEGQNLVN
jgi:hypothetical protein